jgi:stress-induced morphogen
MITVEEVEDLLEAHFPGDAFRVEDMTGTSDHFAITVTSKRFEGLPLLEQHRLVHQACSAHMQQNGGDIHALKIKTSTPS